MWQDKKLGVVGEPYAFKIDAESVAPCGGILVEAYLVDPSGVVAPVEVEDKWNGTYEGRCMTNENGKQNLATKFNTTLLRAVPAKSQFVICM